jgi:hypothetical protein
MERLPEDDAKDCRELPGHTGDAQSDRLADRLLKLGKDCAAHLKEPFKSADHADLLYDEQGLPRER